MEFRVTGLGVEPYFVEKPNGEAAGLDLDTLKIMTNKVGANLKFEPVDDWINVKEDANGTEETLVGCIPEVFYKRATFAVAQAMLLEEINPFIDFLVHADQKYRYLSPKPQVNFILKNQMPLI